MKINDKGYWENNTAEGHGVDKNLASGLVRFFLSVNTNSVVDVGCGTGYYTRKLLEAGVHCDGFDGNPNTPEISGGLCKVRDFSQLIIPFVKYDWVMSLEVGEHIPKEYEATFITNLDNFSRKGVVLSWALEGQGGDGHINCRNNDYIRKYFAYLGYKVDEYGERMLRDSSSKYPETGYWFKDTLMVFTKE